MESGFGWEASGETAPSPGKKNVAGETLWDPLNPPHPAPKRARIGMIPKRKSLKFNRTIWSIDMEPLGATLFGPDARLAPGLGAAEIAKVICEICRYL